MFSPLKKIRGAWSAVVVAIKPKSCWCFFICGMQKKQSILGMVYGVGFMALGLRRWVYGKIETDHQLSYIYIVDNHLSRATLIIKNHQQSSTLIKHHQSSSKIIYNHHQQSSFIIIYHQKSSVIIIYHHLSLIIIIDHHLSSFIIIDHPLTFKGDEKPIEGIPGSGTGL